MCGPNTSIYEDETEVVGTTDVGSESGSVQSSSESDDGGVAGSIDSSEPTEEQVESFLQELNGVYDAAGIPQDSSVRSGLTKAAVILKVSSIIAAAKVNMGTGRLMQHSGLTPQQVGGAILQAAALAIQRNSENLVGAGTLN